MSKNQNYSPELRAETVKLVLEQGLSQPAASERLSIPKGTLGNWIVAAKKGSGGPGKVAPGSRSVTELETENARLRKELIREWDLVLHSNILVSSRGCVIARPDPILHLNRYVPFSCLSCHPGAAADRQGDGEAVGKRPAKFGRGDPVDLGSVNRYVPFSCK